MTKSKQLPGALPSSGLKEKKTKIFYEHGKDGLGLALSIAEMQEDKALRKAEKHHQPQAGKPRSVRRDRASDKRKRLDETKALIAKQRAQSKKQKVGSHRESRDQLQRRDHSKINIQGAAKDPAPRKTVSFA
ncbi:hypothetical protein HYDPIDRAFT_29638 [Hydnomerulius pinastri MD-312]|uniref:Uncharacterized protein n=1 Tax=Hydnomerulius pinastri MD-312 TaxID=994086 RepID=A0A0C9VYG8_9AGAM|nr:hypothetical protein HYDPIDRAFT_29638 [Hydnomerulius pinastri MD-312]